MSEFAIDITNAAKTYKGKIRALRGVDMRVGRGEVFGLLGPNGAGKSTLVKILMTVIRPSSCEGTVLGNPVADKATLSRVGYLPEHHRFPGYLKGWQVLDFYGAMAGMPRKVRKKQVDDLLELVGMTDWRKKRIKQYSKGMRQRIGIAQALMNDPELVLLDEPTDGVDPMGRRDIREICQRLRDEGRTVFINSHLLSELEMVCDRVAIMVQGKIARQGTIEELTEGQQHYEIELVGEAGPVSGAVLETLPLVGVKQLPGDGSHGGGGRGALSSGEWLELSKSTLRIGTDDPVKIQPILSALVGNGHTIRTVRAHRPSLEDLFMATMENAETGEKIKPGAIGQDSSRDRRTAGAAEGGDA